MSIRQADLLNIALLFVSLIFAYLLPFRIFLFGYAILGPLHYLTEINWLHEKNYFVKPKRWLWIPVSFVLLILVPKLFVLSPFQPLLEHENLKHFLITWERWSNGLIILWLLASIGLVFSPGKVSFWIFVTVGVLIAVLLREVNMYLLIVGILIPTVIHVYVFTVLFMLYGATKSQSREGFISIGLILLVPLMIAFTEIDPGNYFFSDGIKETFVSNNFHVLITRLAALLGLSDGKSFFFYEEIELKMQIFIAFAYIYHYLNWFSKTTEIGWHKNLTTPRTIAIIGVWLISVGLFAYDYTLGLILLVTLSMLHVLLEFPLNILSIQGIGKYFGGRWR